MKNRIRITTSTIKVNKSYEGERIEAKIARMMNNKEPIKDEIGALIYEERRKGVNPNHDIRTDRWEHAVEEATNLAKSTVARREHKNKMAEEAKKNMEIEKKNESSKGDGSAESTQATK